VEGAFSVDLGETYVKDNLGSLVVLEVMLEFGLLKSCVVIAMCFCVANASPYSITSRVFISFLCKYGGQLRGSFVFSEASRQGFNAQLQGLILGPNT
jgi:hypothetical protein